MQRIAFMMRLKPGCEAEYQRRHDDLWPEMQVLMDEAGIRNYSIFLHETMLFNYFECADWNAASAIMSRSDVSARWRDHMRELMVADERGDLEQTPLWTSVFYRE